MQESLDKKRKAAERVTLIGSAIDLALGIAKIFVGFIANSGALIADGVHSLSDLATDFLVIVVLRFSHQAPDRDHPYGHGRYETVATVLLGAILIVVGLGLAYEVLMEMIENTNHEAPGILALVVAGISILAKEWIFRYSLKIGKELKSDLLIANAWHSRSDALSSIVVFFAVGGAMLGIWWLDALAAIAVGAFVGKIGWELVVKNINELVDTALPPERVKEFRDVVNAIEGVLSVHDFKSRGMGNQAILEMHIQVKPYLSAAEAHYIGDCAVQALQAKFDDIGHVIFHIDTFDDRPFQDVICSIMPERKLIKAKAMEIVKDVISSDIDTQDVDLMLFYHPEYVDLEVRLTHKVSDLAKTTNLTQRDIERQIEQKLTAENWCREVKVWWSSQV